MPSTGMYDRDAILGGRKHVSHRIVDDTLAVALTDKSVVLSAVACQYGESR